MNPVPVVFMVLCVVGWYFSGMALSFVVGEVLVRFVRDGILVLALIVPVRAGLGLNFAITIGAMAAQVGLLVVLDQQVGGWPSLLLATGVGVALAALFGVGIGCVLNRVKGQEMITTMILGFLGTSVYQLVFMAGYGRWWPVGNPEMVLSRGLGVRSMVDLAVYRELLTGFGVVTLWDVDLPLGMIGVVCLFAFGLFVLDRTRVGMHVRAVGLSWERAGLLGLDADRVRVRAMMVSTVLAAVGQIVFLQNIGMLNVYTAHLNADIFSCAALLAGGATIAQARVRHALVGIFLFHSLFIVSPQAGQNVCANAALGEYFRSFVAYGTIAFALSVNLRRERRAAATAINRA